MKRTFSVRWSLAVFLAGGVLLVGRAAAAGGPCDRLKTKEQKALVEALLATEHAYDCCDETLKACLAKPKVCKLVRRLHDDICRRVAKGEDRATIERALKKRAESMVPWAKPAKFNLGAAPRVGEGKPGVTLVVYACARCPFCARLLPEVYRDVTEGRLRGKVALYFRMFPIRSHKDSTPANLAFEAAHRLGGFWRYMLHAYANFSSFSVDKQGEWAQAVGLERQSFDRLLSDPSVRDAVVESKKEGIVNKVDATPTFFMNGRKITVPLDLETLRDLVDEELDRLQGATHCGG